MSDAYEEVLVVTEYFDGPRSGVALFEGRPHSFASTFKDVYSADELAKDVFELRPVEHRDDAELVLAYGEFKVAPDAPPAAPGALRKMVVRWIRCGGDGV